MSNNGNASFYQTTNSSTSTLRPRNNLSRLISYESDSQHDSVIASSTASTTSPRSTSPSASTSITRARSKGKSQNAQRNSISHKQNALETTDRRASSSNWPQWSSFQSLGSSLWATESSNQPIRRASSVSKQKATSRMTQDKSYGLKQAQGEWGPKSQTTPKPTSIEEQKALLQAKRREALLLQSAEATVGKDSLGRYKRKDSNASVRGSPIENPNEGDVLVYRHKVQPQDTMAGVVIKYSCQPEAFRKVNRFWPNDNIQRRDFVVLPVDACSVRGKRTDGPYVADLFEDGQGRVEQPLSTTDGVADTSRVLSLRSEETEPFPLADSTSPDAEDSPYKHDSWVLLPTNPKPVEILRISRRALGYFPPARRKSQTSSTPFTDSTASTPKTSFDMLRHPPSHAAQQAQLNEHLRSSLTPNQSPSRQSSRPRYLNDSFRTRSSSTVSTSAGTSNAAFLCALSGPGGVGTLRGLRSERARPGPADDPLNKKFAQYAADLLPPDHPDYRPSSTANANSGLLQPPHPRTASTSLRTTPRASMDSIRSTRSNSSSVPAAIAGWMGKVASSPMRKKADGNRFDRGERGDLSLKLDVLGEAVAGDLIELADTPDEVSRQLHDAVEDRTPIAAPRAGIGIAGADGSDEQELLDERFPIRGRVRRAYEAD